MYGGAGDDWMIVADTNFHRVRGGTGFDTLALAGGLTLDLEAQRGHLDEIEQIDLSEPGGDTLSIRRLDLLNLSPTSNQLFVLGTGEDQVISIGDMWTNEGVFDVRGVNHTKLTDGRAELFVQQSVNLRFSPTIMTDSLEIAENSPVDTSIGFVVADDPGGGTVVNFTIVGGDIQNVFDLDAVTGQLFVNGAIDFETQSVYELSIEATDDTGDVGSRTVIVDVICLNEAPVWTQQEFITPMDEHAPAGTSVGSFTAVDPDSDDVVTYVIDLDDASLTSPALPGAFGIDAVTGELTVADGSLLDWENQPTQELIVYATDLLGLRTTGSLVSVALEDVQSWTIPLVGSFETTGASMWSTDGSVGASPIMFEKSIDGANEPAQSFSILGVGITIDVDGNFDFNATVTTDSGSVSARLPFEAELVLPDEVQLGQSFDLQVSLPTPAEEPVLHGMTPAADLDLLLAVDEFEVLTTPWDFGPYTGSNTGEEYLNSSVSQPWTATLQPNGTLATDSTLVTDLLEVGNIDWDSYLLNFLFLAGLPTNEGSIEDIEYLNFSFDIEYILWAFDMAGSVRVEQDLALEPIPETVLTPDR